MALSSVSGPVKATFELPEAATSASLARRLTRAALEGQRDSDVDTIELLVSELVTNAILHARSAPTLRIETGGHRTRVSVHDQSGGHPEVRASTEDSTGGRGLLLVETLAASWGWESTTAGKGVWFEV
jgi:anti-sigma regulatory factor (Ser/Thr protein kinase)